MSREGRGGGSGEGAERQAGDAYSAELPGGRKESAAAVASVADAWDAQWDPDEGAAKVRPGAGLGGRLVLPRVAGVHRGVLVGRLELLPHGATTRATYQVEEAHDHVHTPAVVILAISALGALMTVIWPFFPELLPLAPFGALLALGGWFLVVSRLQNSGPEEFFHLVEGKLTGDDENGSGKGRDR